MRADRRVTGPRVEVHNLELYLDGWDDHMELRCPCGWVSAPFGDSPWTRIAALAASHLDTV